MTYFYRIFKRYAHFAMENITIPLEGQNELQWDKQIQLRTKIPRFGDLLSDLTLSFDLPAIYSKYLEPGTYQGKTTQWEFQWVPYIGLAAINNAAFFIGGQKIQEVDGSYLLAKALLDMDQDKFAKWSKLVGNVPELTSPAKGEYAGGPGQNTYPTVIDNPSITSGVEANRPSIPARTIHVPLSFWFSQHTGLSVPLVGLQSQECEIQITLNPLEQLYTVLDNSGYRVAPEYSLVSSTENIALNNPEYIQSSDPARRIRNFLVDYGVTEPQLNTVYINPRLQGNFIYLPEDEQKTFATRPLSYLVTQNILYPFPAQFQREVLDIYTSNPVTRLLFLQRRSDWIFRNDFVNFTNWFRYPHAPYRPTPGVPSGDPRATVSSGIVVPNAQKEMIRAIRVICNGNEIQEEKPVDFFTTFTPYTYFKGIGDVGLPVYTFQIEQNPLQPAGSINASRIRSFQVDLDVYPLPAGPNYTYDVNIYTENLNWLLIASGMGGLKFAK